MAKSTHLKILKEGPTAWNKWRRANINVIPDLSGADLTEVNVLTLPDDPTFVLYADLSKYNLTKVNFRSAEMAGVNFEGANLSFADLRKVSCYEANFRSSNLKEVRFQDADLGLSNLSDANLTKANFTKAKMSECRFTRAILKNAILVKAEADLSRFREADLSGADLTDAIFPDTNCHGVNFSKAKLRNCDFFSANLTEANLKGCDLRKANLSQALMGKCNLEKADLSNADLRNSGLRKAKLNRVTAGNADFSHCYLGKADLSNGNFEGANFYAVNFSETDLTKADLQHANLRRAILVRTNLGGASLNGASIYGSSVWDIEGNPKTQKSLVITPEELPDITVDELEVAQFVYLLLNNSKIRNAIDTITSKAVLILGRFYKERKDVLDAIRVELRKRDYIPIVFDFEKPNSRDLTETVSTLAQMSRFIIADISDAKSIPQELSHIIPNNPSLPVASIMAKKFAAYSMYEHFERYPWVLPLHQYQSQSQLIKSLKKKVIIPAEKKAAEIAPKHLS